MDDHDPSVGDSRQRSADEHLPRPSDGMDGRRPRRQHLTERPGHAPRRLVQPLPLPPTVLRRGDAAATPEPVDGPRWSWQGPSMSSCMTCELVARRDRGDAPPWDRIHRTEHWDVAHAFGTSLEGWLVIVARRHVASIAELDDEAAAELGPLIRDLSRALAVA